MNAARKPQSPQSTLLAARLKERIIRNGPLSVADFMESCLSDDTAGYYSQRQPIGEDGDFVTAPEISQIFGELLGIWAIAAWQSMGEPKSFVVAELGPGRGTLMVDALRAWKSAPAFLAGVTVAMVDTSPLLREAQQAALKNAHVPIQWFDAIEDAPQGPLIVLANEFIDALPIRQLLWSDGGWRERCVTIGPEGGFAFCAGRMIANNGLRQATDALDTPDGSVLEVRPEAAALVSLLSARAQTAPLAALIIDYGHGETACGDTLQAVWRHKYADPLSHPGEVDLTAHVDFAALKDSASAHGLQSYGPMPQGEFLLKLGLEARRDRLCKNATPKQQEQILASTIRLADPEAMGLLFKVMAITSSGLAAPTPFVEI